LVCFDSISTHRFHKANEEDEEEEPQDAPNNIKYDFLVEGCLTFNPNDVPGKSLLNLYYYYAQIQLI
jgi:hypothetical protein